MNDPFETANHTLDARGMECPQPVLECRKQLRRMAAGETLHIIADDPNSQLDFEVFCIRSGHSLLATRVDEAYHFLISRRTG